FAVVALLVGLTQQWKAPVATSTLVLAAIAFTQGGPFVAYVPGWLILGVAGAALLTAGVAWERAVNAGRVANRWFRTLN
ncbi:MAG: SCO7613 C-terminal domain-containing membrane protein, partial [Nocardioides sp.]